MEEKLYKVLVMLEYVLKMHSTHFIYGYMVSEI